MAENKCLTPEDCKKISKQINFDKLFDSLMVEYKKKKKTKKIELVRKEK